MLGQAVVRIVVFCAQWRWSTLIFGILLASVAAAYDVTNFGITTDTESLISNNLPWRQRQEAFSRSFPEKGILIVVTAPTPEASESATTLLTKELSTHPELFRGIVRPDGGEFFRKNSLLFAPLSSVKTSISELSRANVLVGTLASDPSLRGVVKTLDLAIQGVYEGELTLEQLAKPLSLANRSLADLLTGRPASFSWQELVQGASPQMFQLRHFIEVQPVLDFSSLQPGHKAAEAIFRAAKDLGLTERFGADVQLTGSVPLNDQQFSVIQQSSLRDTLAALFGTLIILWIALRSWKIIAAVFLSVIAGLALTAALGLLIVGAFNLLSVAFFVLFVGLGVDFGIQFSIRYRAERHECQDLPEALRRAARKVGAPLTLAAAATALAFFSFTPTSYKGLFELGLVAGCGMVVAFACSITLVPAMLALLEPPGEPTSVGFARLAAVDDALQRHRWPIIIGTIIVVLAGTPLLFRVPFDFNPLNLQNPASPAVVTYRELQGNPLTSGTDADVVAASLNEANVIAKHLSTLPEVARTLTLTDFIPSDQDQKIAAINAAAPSLHGALNPKRQPPPSDLDTVSALRSTAYALSKLAGTGTEPGAEVVRLTSTLLIQLAQSDFATRRRAEQVFLEPLNFDLDLLRDSLDPKLVTAASLPAALVQRWLLPDGRARVQVLPKGDQDKHGVLSAFATSVLAVEPSATGPAISLYESGRTVIEAFIEAGALALGAITILLLIALRRVRDVLLTLIPLLIAGAVTLEICALTGTAINFANIIALPLLLGVGVAFKIYYVMAWRAGRTRLLESSLTRAVTFSALTNAVAFGSMWTSDYPGMSSMGKMMALALICTMAAAVLFQPILMGPPRKVAESSTLLPEPAE